MTNGRNTNVPSRRSDSAIPPLVAHDADGHRIDDPQPARLEDEGGLVAYWHLIRRRRTPLIIACVAGAIAGALLTAPQRRLYQSRASLEVQGLNGDFMNLRQVDPNSPIPSYVASDTYVQTEIKILQSDTLSDGALAAMKQRGQLFAEPDAGWRAPLRRLMEWDWDFTTRADPLHRTAKRLVDSLNVRTAAGQTRVVELRADSFSAQMAADYLNTLIAEYLRADLDSRLEASRRTQRWLTQQLDDMRARLENSEDRLQSYARQAGLVFASERPIVEDKLREIQTDLTRAQTDRVAKQTRAERARDVPADSLPDVLSDRTLRDARRQLIELNRQLAQLNANDNSERANVSGVKAAIASVDATIKKQQQTIVERIRKDADEALRREKLLEEAYAAQARLVTDSAGRSVQYNMLKREVDTNRQLYEGVLQRVKEAGFAVAMQSANVRIIDPAAPPEKSYRPRLGQNVAIGLIGGVLIGLLFVTTREGINQTVRSPGEVPYYLRVPELGVIPLSGPSPMRRFDAFRSTSLSILRSSNGAGSPRTLIVTSADPMAGTSTVAANLAIALAVSNRRVLLIDGNLRRPSLHTTFGLTKEAGLRDLLVDRAALDAIDRTIRETSERNVSLITSGSGDTPPTALLHPDQLARLIDRLRGGYDTIIIDTPPVLQFPDARLFGHVADAAILIARAERTTREALAAARDRLSEDGIPILGTILYDWNPRNSPTGYYGSFNGDYERYQRHYDGSDRPAAPDS